MSIPRLGNRDLEQFVAILQEDDSGKLTKFSDAVLEMAESVAQSMHRSELLGDRLESWEMEAATAEADCITATNKLDGTFRMLALSTPGGKYWDKKGKAIETPMH